MKKAIIPGAIACAFGVFGLVLTINGFSSAAASGLQLESAGGTDEEVKTLDQSLEAMKSPALRSSSYYSALIGQDKDPEPVKDQANSIGVVCTGSGKMNGTEFNRTLTIAENEKGFVYQYVGTETKNNVTAERDFYTAVSRYGAFVKFNKFILNSGEGSVGYYLEKAISKKLGKWYYVGIYDSRKPSSTNPMDAMIYGMCQSVATEYSQMFFNNVDTNNQTLASIANVVQMKKDTLDEKTKGVYSGKFDANYNIEFDLNDTVSPRVTLTYVGDKSKNYEEENLYIAHIDNCKVEIVEKSSGDFYDLFAGAIEDYISNGMA